MKILVTGAAGFIGGQLWHTLWKRGDEVVGIDNFSYGNPDNLKFDDHDFGAEVRRMDIRDKAGMLALFEAEKFDVVYNIAGIAPLPDCQSDPVQAIEVNTLGLVNLLEAGRRTGIRQLVQASTNAMYENETEFPTVESKFNPPTLIYPNTKYCGERFAQSFADTYGMTVTCLRFANVYGPHIDCLRKQPPFVGYMIRELYYDRTPEFHSDGNQRRDYIYVDDLIALALRVVEVRGHGDDGLRDVLAEERLGVAAELPQDHGRKLLRRERLAVDARPPVAPHAALHGRDGAVGVHGRLPAGDGAHQALAVLRERHHARRGALALRVRHDGGPPALHRCRTAVRGSQIDAYRRCHASFPFNQCDKGETRGRG